MRFRPTWPVWLSLAAGALWAGAGDALAQADRQSELGNAITGSRMPAGKATIQVPLDELAPSTREKVRAVLERPTLSARGKPETFICQPELYYWFLDHPDRAAMIWRRLGAKVVDMADRGDGRFGWNDGQGSEIRWEAVYRGKRLRVWHAEGKVKAGALLPLVPVHAVVVLHIQEGRDSDGKAVIRHQAELALHADSKTANLAARVFGASAPRLAEQYVSQVEMFF